MTFALDALRNVDDLLSAAVSRIYQAKGKLEEDVVIEILSGIQAEAKRGLRPDTTLEHSIVIEIAASSAENANEALDDAHARLRLGDQSARITNPRFAYLATRGPCLVVRGAP